MISAAQAREALVLLGWTPLTLAARAFLALDDVTRALDDVAIRHLGGLQLEPFERPSKPQGWHSAWRAAAEA